MENMLRFLLNAQAASRVVDAPGTAAE